MGVVIETDVFAVRRQVRELQNKSDEYRDTTWLFVQGLRDRDYDLAHSACIDEAGAREIARLRSADGDSDTFHFKPDIFSGST